MTQALTRLIQRRLGGNICDGSPRSGRTSSRHLEEEERRGEGEGGAHSKVAPLPVRSLEYQSRLHAIRRSLASFPLLQSAPKMVCPVPRPIAPRLRGAPAFGSPPLCRVDAKPSPSRRPQRRLRRRRPTPSTLRRRRAFVLAATFWWVSGMFAATNSGRRGPHRTTHSIAPSASLSAAQQARPLALC